MKDLKKATNLGQDKLNEAIGRLVKREVVKRESEGLHAGRDGATRYRIISLPPYDPEPASHAEESPEVENPAVASVVHTSEKGPAHKQTVAAPSVNELPHPSQPAKPQSETEKERWHGRLLNQDHTSTEVFSEAGADGNGSDRSHFTWPDCVLAKDA